MKFLVIFALLFSFYLPIFAQDELVEDSLAIIKKTDLIRAPEKSFAVNLKVIDYLKKEVKSETDFKLYVRGVHEEVYRSLAKWTGPIADKGKIMLMNGTVFWLYTPGTRNSIRISPAQRLAGLASSADIGSVNFQHDYKVIFKVLENYEGHLCYKLFMIAKNEEVAYHALELLVSQKTYRPVMCKHYALSGRLLKTSYFKNFKAALGEKRPHEILIVDAVDQNHTTQMVYDDMAFEEKPIHMYNKDYLPNIKD